MAIQILVIDDDQELGKLLKNYLAKFGMKVTYASHPDQGLALLKEHHPSLVILDLMLPGKDGFEVCKEVRKLGDTPIIMLTARGDVADRVVGLEIGADDYVPKPFEPRELVARIQAVLKRTDTGHKNHGKGGILSSGQLTVDIEKRTARLGAKPLALTTTEFDILALFMKNPGATIDRDKIMEYTRGVDVEAFNRSVDLSVSRLRHKLGDSAENQKYIKTIWGSGYMFLGEVKHRAS